MTDMENRHASERGQSAGIAWDGYLRPLVWAPLTAVLVAIALALGVGWAMAGSQGEAETGSQPFLAPDGTLRQPVHWHADFAVVIRGEQFDFADDQFWSTEGEEKNPYVHIHEPRSTVVHAHREQTTWDEFLMSLGFKLTDTELRLPDGTSYITGDGETLKFFVNGVRIDTLMFQDIADLNQVLISFGPESDAEALHDQWPLVSDEACIPSGLCRDRGLPADEPCGKGSGSCTG